MKSSHSNNRLPPEKRRAQILQDALSLSREKGLYGWSWSDLTLIVGLNGGAIRYHFPSLRVIRRKIILAAIQRGDIDLIMEAVKYDDPAVKRLPAEIGAQVTERLGNV